MHQGELNLSAADSIAFMNAGTKYKLACAVNEANWQESLKPLGEAMQWASNCESYGNHDCYVSGNTFLGRRSNFNVREITRFTVDLDYYETECKDLEPFELWEVIQKKLPWLPEPTLITSSGRGAYLTWKFKRPLPINRKTNKHGFPAQWQTCQDFIIEQLKPFGADPKASDIARVLRLPGTINSKNYARAETWNCGPQYEFTDLKAIFNEIYNTSKPEKQPKTLKRKKTKNIEHLFTWHSLAWNRMRDIEKLAKLRGGKLTDHRRMAIFYFSVEACHYCRSEESLKREVSHFVNQYIAEPHKYDPFKKGTVNIKEVIRRFNEQEKRGHFTWLTEPSKNRYLLKTQTIIDGLEITKTESKSLKTLISKDEKYHRRVTKRREKGIQERSAYLEQASNRKALARKLFSEGVPKDEIAERLNVTLRSINNYLRV